MSLRVLLVCTDAPLADWVRGALGGPENEIVHVASPHRALGLVDAGERFDVVVADADTTPEGGFALSRELKARQSMDLATPPVALLITRPDDAWLASWARADAFVRKPADPFDLAQVVGALARGEAVPELPGVGLPQAPVAGDIFGVERLAAPETAAGAGP